MKMNQANEEQSLLSDQDDARTPRTAEDHHAGLRARLTDYADELINDVAAGNDPEPARLRLAQFLHDDVLAHLESEKRVLYGAARRVGAGALVASLEVDHDFLLSTIARTSRVATGLEAALSAHALMVLFTLRIKKEETVLIPMLTEAGIDVSVLLEGMIVQMTTDYGSRFTYL